MKLKGGCLYLNRLGEIVLVEYAAHNFGIKLKSFYVVKISDPSSLPGYYLFENGKFYGYNAKHDSDVISEVNDPVLRSFYDYGE